MTFPHGKTVYRLRAKDVIDPYSKKPVAGDWNDPDVLALPGAFIAQSSTSSVGDVSRTQALEAKSLYCEATADVLKGDRIRDGGPGSPIYPVDGIPAADTNPFTGWTPVREVPLTRSVG